MEFQEKSIYSPYGRSKLIPRGTGVLKAKVIEAKYEAKLEFPGGRGLQIKQKKHSGRGVWIFSRTQHNVYLLKYINSENR